MFEKIVTLQTKFRIWNWQEENYLRVRSSDTAHSMNSRSIACKATCRSDELNMLSRKWDSFVRNLLILLRNIHGGKTSHASDVQSCESATTWTHIGCMLQSHSIAEQLQVMIFYTCCDTKQCRNNTALPSNCLFHQPRPAKARQRCCQTTIRASIGIFLCVKLSFRKSRWNWFSPVRSGLSKYWSRLPATKCAPLFSSHNWFALANTKSQLVTFTLFLSHSWFALTTTNRRE